ncbi:MAG: phenylalanine--tRNA ligase subunit alpha [Saprospiraceae bacterium]|jgi:phenylalanyl-tRNA synthetase alpha chain|nr:phenylalanine--tRNA ligase subunit alpha [Saprospiraceae bacterium]MBK8826077.1 phenylalanine--tRNA ligase subunit alpha [Saprospiraceae bacterium]MBK9582621.1 phenylalanine--tRNA ligase subunit alpha [Saprospiraceae bacterium]MBK9741899.1 phenylalanine--tRNA ligase subunit alpha [Saprospiraceae bacterium]MBP6539524.1 phenylalanine--tRNA ligase subunit alpha [Saprospiraceae bacterium]
MSSEIFAKVQRVLEILHTETITDATSLESFRIKYLGSKNEIKALFGEIKNVDNDRKKEFGQLLNDLKQAAEEKFELFKEQLESTSGSQSATDLDLTAPVEMFSSGSRHPVSLILNKIINIFGRIGFTVAEEREIEDDWHNFSAMNTPEDHPARDMQDTFYLKDSTTELLRTHTSSVQARIMTTQKPPIRIIAPGRVYRNETISSRSHCQFHQVEGLYIDKNVSFADMKQTLLYFAREMYGPQAEIRLRPSFFPFTEPSAEMDVYWGLNNEDDYRITKGTGWLEILGCGMVDPNVLINCGIDPEVYSGFAFGMGIERQAMLQYKITDIRQLFENDARFLRQFSGVI